MEVLNVNKQKIKNNDNENLIIKTSKKIGT